MPTFQLFRARLERLPQPPLDLRERQFDRLLRDALLEAPSGEFYRGSRWHIGNTTALDERGFYFRIGRVKAAQLEQYDEDRAEFREMEASRAPYTHAIIDIRLQVCAIASNAEVASSMVDIANMFARLLTESDRIRHSGYRVVADEVKDPVSFVTYLRDAYRVRKFTATFSRPNLFDAEEDFVRPLERVLESVDGTHGTADIEGEALDKDALEEVSRSVAAAGEDASAELEQAEGQRVTKSLGDNPITFDGEIDTEDSQRRLLERLRELYVWVRRRRGDDGE